MSRQVQHPFDPWDDWEQRLLDAIERAAVAAGIDITADQWWVP